MKTNELISLLDGILFTASSSTEGMGFDEILNRANNSQQLEIERLKAGLVQIESHGFSADSLILRKHLIDARLHRIDENHPCELYQITEIDTLAFYLQNETPQFVIAFVAEVFNHEDIPNPLIIPLCDRMQHFFPEIKLEFLIVKCKALSCERKNIEALKLFDYLEMQYGNEHPLILELSGFIGLC